MNLPPVFVRTLTRFSRTLPFFRGRGRFYHAIHNYIAGKGWNDEIVVNGYKLNVLLDDLISRTVYVEGEFDKTSTDAMKHLIKPGSLVLDVGANMGYYTLFFSKLVGPSGQVFAFEPIPQTIERLKQNLQANPDLKKRVQVFEVALSDKNDKVLLNVASTVNTGASHVVTSAQASDDGRMEAGIVETIEIDCRRADDIISENAQTKPVAMIKIDIEGHEYFALRGMQKILSSKQPLAVMMEIRSAYLEAAGSSREMIFDFMGSLGYNSFDFQPGDKTFKKNNTPRDGELVVFKNY